jgi:hypothetical protein
MSESSAQPPAGRPHGHVHLRDASWVVTALSEACRLGIPHDQRVNWLLEHVGTTVQPGLDFVVLLLDTIERWPAPRVIDRASVGPSFTQKPPAPMALVQRSVDESAPLRDMLLGPAMARLRNPTTYIYSIDTDPAWFLNVYRPLVLAPRGWVDALTAVWASSEQRLVVVQAFSTETHEPFDDRQRDQMSLITRAVAPIMDSQLFAPTVAVMQHAGASHAPVALPPTDAPAGAHTSPRREPIEDDFDCVRTVPADLRRTLAELLHGFNTREIAGMSSKMTDEVEIELLHLCKHFDVGSEGKLIALFVDRRVFAMLDDLDQHRPRAT